MTTRAVIDALEHLLVETLLSEEARRQYGAGDISRAELKPYCAAIERLSANYVNRDNITPLTDEEAVAYALYYTPVNAAKVLHLCDYLPVELRQRRNLRILDYGCGPGTAALAASFLTVAPTICAVDSVEAMRRVATRLLTARAKDAPLTFLVSRDFSGSFDLIIAANVLNELTEPSAENLLDRLINALTPNGYLITLEPALFETTRNHMMLRNRLLARHPDIGPIFPCTHRAPCPMLVKAPAEWCHAPLCWNEPRLVRQIDTIVGFNKHRPKFSAFIFARNASIPPGIRLIRGVEKTKRGASALSCSADYFGELHLSKRDKTEHNRAFFKGAAYDRIEATPPPKDGVLGADSCVKILDESSGSSEKV